MRVYRASQRRILSEYIVLKKELAERHGAPRIIGEDPQLRHVLQRLHHVAGTDATVLLEGESGTGKELFARALHAFSSRAGGPFVAINCAAIPDGLLETELFGHERGAFTGAIGRKPGRFEMAHRGTLFLDEIGDMPLGLQAKIQRAIEEKQFERVGSTSSAKISTSASQSFRSPFRPCASVRPTCRPSRGTSSSGSAAISTRRRCSSRPRRLANYGNMPGQATCVELQNCIERAVILCDGDTILPRHLNLSLRRAESGRLDGAEGHESTATPAEDASPLARIDRSGTMAEAVRRVTAVVERLKLDGALRNARGNKARAAEALQISYKALLRKQREYGITD